MADARHVDGRTVFVVRQEHGMRQEMSTQERCEKICLCWETLLVEGALVLTMRVVRCCAKAPQTFVACATVLMLGIICAAMMRWSHDHVDVISES